MLALALLSPSSATAMPPLKFNAFYNAHRDKLTPRGTLDEVYNRTFKANTVGRWTGKGTPAAAIHWGLKAATRLHPLLPFRTLLKAYKAGRLTHGLSRERRQLRRDGKSRLTSAFALGCLLSPTLGKAGLAVFAGQLAVSAARAQRDIAEAFCLSQAATFAAAAGAGIAGVDKPLLDTYREEVGKLLRSHQDTRRRASSALRDHVVRARRGGLQQLVSDEIITAKIATLRREQRALREIRRVLTELEQAP